MGDTPLALILRPRRVLVYETISEADDGLDLAACLAAIAGRRPLLYGLAAPQHGAHPRRQLAEAEGLGDVIVGAELEPAHAIVFGCARGEHDDRNVLGVGSPAQDPADFHAAEDRKVQIEDHEVWRTIGHRFERRIAAPDDFRFGFAAALEGVFDQGGDVVFVFDDEDAVPGHQWTAPS